MPFLKVRKNGITETVYLYTSKPSSPALACRINGETYYAMMSASADVGNAGLRSVMKVKYGNVVYNVLNRKTGGGDKLYGTYTSGSYTITTDNEKFGKYGGYILVQGGAGGSTGAGSGGAGGVKRIEIPSGLSSFTFTVSLGTTAGKGAAGGTAAINTYHCKKYNGGYGGNECSSQYTAYGYGNAGGAAGANATCQLYMNGKAVSLTAYGGGGAGGAGGSVSGHTRCYTGDTTSSSGRTCSLYDYKTAEASNGSGGKSGNGVSWSGTNGGSGYNASTDYAQNSSNSANVRLYYYA